MRFALLFTLSLFGLGVCRAESPAPLAAPLAAREAAEPARPGVVEQRSERIHVEDAGSSIDELRVGGETRSITVQPKGHFPAYQIAPSSGERSWKILSF